MPYNPLQTLHGAKPNKQDTFVQKLNDWNYF